MGRSSFQPSPALPSPATWSLNGLGDPQLWVKPHISSALLPPSLPTLLLRLLPPWPSCRRHPVKEKRPRGPSSRHTSSHPPSSRSCLPCSSAFISLITFSTLILIFLYGTLLLVDKFHGSEDFLVSVVPCVRMSVCQVVNKEESLTSMTGAKAQGLCDVPGPHQGVQAPIRRGPPTHCQAPVPQGKITAFF